MREDKRITQEDIDRSQVRLRPILGLEPGHWLAILYALGIAALLFAVFVLPGIRKNGSLLIVDSRPSGSAVFLDGAYAGATPCEVFAIRGKHGLAIRRPSFSSFEREIDVGGRLVGSLLFPRKQNVDARLDAVDPRSAMHRAIEEFSLWSLAGRPSATYQYPLVLSESLLALSESGKAAALPRSESAAFIAAALAASGGEHSARDAIRAAFLAAAGGAPSPLGLVAGLEALGNAVGRNPALGPWLETVLPQAAREKMSGLDGVAALRKKNEILTAKASTLPASAGAPLRVGRLEFRPVPAGDLIAKGETPDGAALAYSVSLPSFHIASTEVTRGQWADFLASAREWRPENRSALLAAAKVDEAYLADWSDGEKPDLPVTGISWPAAVAFCSWLSKESPAGYSVELPSETMWERAAFAGGENLPATLFTPERKGPAAVASAGRNRLGLADMLGNVWEWCSDSYLPVPALSPEVSEWMGIEKTVRGGSWANRPGSVGLSSRGSFKPAFSSPFLGFRPVLIHK